MEGATTSGVRASRLTPSTPTWSTRRRAFRALGTILSSTDQGNTWTANPIPVSIAGNNDGREAGERLVVDPNLTSTLYFGSRWQGLWKSTNSAASWSQVTSFPVLGDTGYGLSWEIILPGGNPSAGAETIFVGVEAGTSKSCNIYRSTNAGGSWAEVPGGPVSVIPPHASLGTDGNLWIVCDIGYISQGVTYGYGPNSVNYGQIWKLNTSTLAWSNVTPSNGPVSGSGGYAGICVDHENASHVVVSTIDWWGGPDRLLSTTNGGGSWSVIAEAGSGNSVFNVNGAIYQEGCSGGSGGAGWAGCVAIDPFNSNNAVYPSGGAGGGGGVWSSANIQANPVSWTYTDNNLEETVPVFMPPSAAGGILFSCLGDVGGMRHTNVTQSPASGMYCNPQFTNTNMLDFAESRPNTVVRAGNSTNSSSVNSDVAYSTNNGQTWTPWGSAPPGYTTTGQMGAVAVAADGSHVVVSPYSGNGSPAYASSLGGSWTTCSGLPSGAMVASDRSNASTFYGIYPSEWVYGNSVTIYLSTNYGASFTQVNSVPVNWGDANGNGQWVIPRPVFGEPGEFWVSTYNALYRFTNAGSSVTALANVYEPKGPVGFGKAAPSQTHPAIFLSGTVNGTQGIFRCDDGAGVTWTSISNASKPFIPGWIEGDESIYGRCYIAPGARGILYGDITAGTPTNTATATFTYTRTSTPTLTPTRTPTVTPTGSMTPFPTNTGTESATASKTPTTSMTPTGTASLTASRTLTPFNTATLTSTPSLSFTPTRSITPTMTMTATLTPSQTLTATSTATIANTSTTTSTASSTTTRTNTLTSTPTASASPTPTLTITPSRTMTATTTNTIANTLTPTGTNSVTPTVTPSPTYTTTRTTTMTATSTLTSTSSITSTGTASFTSTATRTLTPPNTATLTWTPSLSFTPTATATPTHTGTASQTPVFSPTTSHSPAATLTPTSSFTETGTFTPTATWTPSPSHTPTLTPTASSTLTLSQTPTRTYTPVDTVSSTDTGTPSSTGTPTQTPAVSPTASNSPTATLSPTWTATATPTFTQAGTLTATSSPTETESPTVSLTPTTSITPSGTASLTPTQSGTPTQTPVFSLTVTLSPTSTETTIWTMTITPTSTAPWTLTPTGSATRTGTPTMTGTPTRTPVFSPTPSNSPTATLSPTSTGTATWTMTATPTFTNSWTFTPSSTATETKTTSGSPTATGTSTLTGVLSPTPTNSPTASLTASSSPTASSTQTRTYTPTSTWTLTPSSTVPATPTLTGTITTTEAFTSTTTPAPTVPPGVVGIYPNPAQGPTVEILASGYTGLSNVRIEIFSISFRKVRDETFPSIPSGTAVTLTLTGRGGNPLANGIYYVVVTNKAGRAIGKLLILK